MTGANDNSVIVLDPATGDEIARFTEMNATELREAIQRARAAQPAWAALPLRDRKHLVKRMRDWLVENADYAARLIRQCTGKPLFEAFSSDVTPAIFGNAWYVRNARRFLSPEKIPSGSVILANKRSRLYRKPLGVIGIISPWNYPLGIPIHEIVPALLAGNTVVFKTSPETLPVGAMINDMCKAAGLPENVFQHVIADGPLCGEAMLEHDGVNKLFFTGSVRVGKLLAEKAAKHLVPVSLELGGKDAMIVLDDANLERAVNGAVWGGMQNAGQACAGVERVYVQRRVYGTFITKLKDKITRLTESDLGVMTTTRQVDTVRAHLDDALEKGATLFAQGVKRFDNPHAVPPTVLTDVNHGMRVMYEETFGPVIGVMPFDTDDEAVQFANDSPYGLTASVWSRNAKRAEALALRIASGAVTINDHVMSHGMTETPWGGVKDSGLGRGHGRFAFHAVTEPQVVIQDRLGFAARNAWWYPYTETSIRALRGSVGLFHGSALRRLRALPDVIKGFVSMFRNH